MESRLARKTLRHDGVYPAAHLGCIGHALAQIFNGNFENVFLCVLTLILFMMPSVLKKVDITLPNTLEIIILLFIYAQREIMGGSARTASPSLLGHGAAHAERLLCAAIGFSLLDIPEPPQRGAVPPVAAVSGRRMFCFSMTVGVIWEFFEVR